jgi:hypothetical protein
MRPAIRSANDARGSSAIALTARIPRKNKPATNKTDLISSSKLSRAASQRIIAATLASRGVSDSLFQSMNISVHRKAQFPTPRLVPRSATGTLLLRMIHAPPGIGRTTGRRFPPLRPDFVTKNLFPFWQVAISGRRLSQPGGGAGAFVMLSTCEQSYPASRMICASSRSR